MNTNLTRRERTKKCEKCKETHPIGRFVSFITLDKNPKILHRIEHEICKRCRKF